MVYELVGSLKNVGTRKSYDNRSFCTLLPCGALIFGVFDAHLGTHAASYSCKFIRQYISHNLEKCREMRVDKVRKVLETSFEKCQISMMVHTHAEKFVVSGTSATVGIIVKNSLWVANVGDSKCLLKNKDLGSVKVVSITDNLKNTDELIRVIQKGSGWYENDLVCNKVKVTRALGDLWQIGALGWQPNTNLRYVNIKALKENQATVNTVKEVMLRKPPSWCLEYHPHVHYEEDVSQFSYIMIHTCSLELLTNQMNCDDDLFPSIYKQNDAKELNEKINMYIAQQKLKNKRFVSNNMTMIAMGLATSSMTNLKAEDDIP